MKLGLCVLFALLGVAASADMYYEFVVKWQMGYPNGIWRNIITINDQFPGPPIIVNVGDTVTVNVTNRLFSEVMTIHWHGILNTYAAWADGSQGVTQSPILPGGTWIYHWKAEEAGTYWYHSHIAAQYTDGLYGAIVINDPNDRYKGRYDEDRIIMIADWSLYDTTIGVTWRQYSFTDGAANVPIAGTLINGKGKQWDCTTACRKCNQTSMTYIPVTAGKTYRLRVLNVAGETGWFSFSIPSHQMTLINSGGVDVAETTVGTIDVGLGVRVDLLLTANQPPDNYWIQARVGGETLLPIPPFFNIQPLLGQDGLAVLYYDTVTPAPPVAAPAAVLPDPFINNQMVNDLIPLNPPTVADPTVTFWYNITLPPPSWIRGPFLVNGVVFEHFHVPLIWQILAGVRGSLQSLVYDVNLNDDVRFIIQDQGPFNMSHPMHLHGYKYMVLGSGRGRYDPNVPLKTVPWLTDSLTMYAGGWAVIQIHASNPGPWLFHCHNDYHFLWGLGMVLSVEPDGVKNWFPPTSDFPLYDDYPAMLPRPCPSATTILASPAPVNAPVWAVLCTVLMLCVLLL